MSAVEKIKQIQMDRAEQARLEEETRNKSLEQRRTERENKEQLDLQEKQARLVFITTQTQKILRESGVLENLLKIDSEILADNEIEHDVRFKPSEGSVTLFWGKNVRSGPVEIFQPDYGVYDYSTVKVTVDPDSEALTIYGEIEQKVSHEQWKDGEHLELAIANAFLNPKKHKGEHHAYYPSEREPWCGSGPTN